jgi:hypothetical protein
MICGSIHHGGRIFSIPKCLDWLEAHLASYSVGTRGLFSRVKVFRA